MMKMDYEEPKVDTVPLPNEEKIREELEEEAITTPDEDDDDDEEDEDFEDEDEDEVE